MRSKLFLFVVITTLLANCHSEINELGIVPSSLTIRLEGELGEVTRVDGNGFCDGDQIGLYGVNYTNSNSFAGVLTNEGNQVDNARYTYDEKNRQWNSTGSIYYKDAETNIDLYAYYPYGSPENVNEYEFDVAVDQSDANVSNGYAKSDFLWGKTENVVPSNDKVKIRFSHRLANAYVVLAEGDGFEEGEFDALEKSVLVSNTIRTASIDLATGIATPVGEASNESIVMRAIDDGFQAIVIPQTVQSGTPLFTITIDGITYKFKQTEDFTFEYGKQSKFTIDVSKKSMTGEYVFTLADCEIINWANDIETHMVETRQYYVVHQEIPGTLSRLIRADNKNPNKIKNLKISGNINIRDFRFMRDSMEILQAVNLKECKIAASWVWTFVKNGELGHLYFDGEEPKTHQEQLDLIYEKYPDLFQEYPNIFSGNITWNAPVSIKDNEIPAYAFCREAHLNIYMGKHKSTLIDFSFPEIVEKIGEYAFSETLLSGSLVIPNNTTEIGDFAFYKTSITSLELPHNLVKIGSHAFGECASLRGNLAFPETLEELSSGAFLGCKQLASLSIPSKITVIPTACFYGCGFSGDLIIPEGVIEIGEGAFGFCQNFTGFLSLPKSLKILGYNAFFGCNFRGELVIPSELMVIEKDTFRDNLFSSIVFDSNSKLTKIETGAFRANPRISEPIIFPSELITIDNDAFYDCNMLPAITLSSTLRSIGTNAFGKCSSISSITCEAIIPPALGSDTFNGVAKDNFTIEVPEQSVSRYQSDSNWGQFRRISAHHDFAISRPQLRVLNAEYSKTYLLRAPANYKWSIENKPDWVTVSPSSGVGKTEVTITVSEMANANSYMLDKWGYSTGCKGRSGEIIFLLDDKDYRSKMAIEQYDYNYGDGDVIVNQTASKGNGVNIVFMGDCFDARDIANGSYIKGINEAIGYYFDIEPYKSYKDYFNVYTVVGMSPDSGVGTVNTVKEAKFGSMYSLNGVCPDETITFENAMKAETVNANNINKTLVVMIENTTDYGGICYMWEDGSAIAICPMSRDAYPFDYRGIVQHEAGGHGFAKLADEYIYTNAFIESCNCLNPHLKEFYECKKLGWYRNLSTNGDMKTVEWSHFIFHPDYSNIVDMYEGGFFHTRGIYRSEPNSCMNNNIPYYSAIQRQEMVERIMRYAGEEFSLEEFYANDVRDASNNNTTRVSIEFEETSATRAAAAKQMAPRIMGDKPKLK